MHNLIDPKDVTINDKVITISKFPAISGREIIAKYPLTGIPKLGDYAHNEEIMLKLMTYVQIGAIRLVTRELIDNHIGSWETLAKIEIAMLEYNCSFFQNGRISGFLDGITENLPALISKILIHFSGQSLPMEKQPSKNSKKVIV